MSFDVSLTIVRDIFRAVTQLVDFLHIEACYSNLKTVAKPNLVF